MKDKAFAAGVNRDDVARGVDLLGIERSEHIQNVIDGMRAIADVLEFGRRIAFEANRGGRSSHGRVHGDRRGDRWAACRRAEARRTSSCLRSGTARLPRRRISRSLPEILVRIVRPEGGDPGLGWGPLQVLSVLRR